MTVDQARVLLGFPPLSDEQGKSVFMPVLDPLADSKAGRVIGSKAAAALKSAVTDALDKAISSINGDATEEDTTKSTKADPPKAKFRGPDADILTQLDDLD